VADEQQAAIFTGLLDRAGLLLSVEALRQRSVQLQALALITAPSGGGDLRGLLRALLGADEHQIEDGSHPRQSEARCSCLSLAALGQPALGVAARPVGLCLGVTE
jgi:hypothetical protein